MTSSEFARHGFDALQRGAFEEACKNFELATANNAPIDVWLGLAKAQENLNKPQAQLKAIDHALAIDPRNLAALLAKGDCLDKAGDIKNAGGFYSSALSVGSQLSSLPPETVHALQRAQTKCQEYAATYERYLRSYLNKDTTHSNQETNGAFERSLDIMFGKRQVYLQQPQKYYFPELPNIQFYDRKSFDWIDELDASTDDIKRELTAIIESGENFAPYVQTKADTPRTDHLEMFDNPDWSAFFLWKDGAVVPENAERCPKTMAVIEKLPLAKIPGNSPSILFSLLRPGSKIPPHTGLINTRLIGHLPLIVPENCGFRVGNETREWKVGETWVFDDTIEHEAWNNSDKNRYVLIFDIEQPSMSTAEHKAVEQLFTAINTYD